MGETFYSEVFDEVLIKGAGLDMFSPGEQASYIDGGSNAPLWEPSWESRCDYPFWERGEILRSVSFEDTNNLGFSVPKVATPSAVVSPTGSITMNIVHKTAPMLIPDREKYHHTVQRLFALMAQFNILTEQQITAFLGISAQETHSAIQCLYSLGVVESPTRTWVHEDKVGKIWRARLNTPEFAAYYEGMDTLWKILSLGGGDSSGWESSPGAHNDSSVRHNLFMAEIVLRLAETCDNVAGVWGDFFASEKLFHTTRDGIKRRKSHGDAILVTRDGGLVILELSTHGLKRGGEQMRVIAEKAASWLGVMSRSDLDISVIFVDVKWAQNRKQLYRAVKTGVEEIGPSYAPDRLRRNKAKDRIGLVNAAWWFPHNNAVSQAATRLTAYSVSDYKFRCLDTPDTFFSTPEHRKNLLINTTASLHNPTWMSNPYRKNTHVSD